MQRVKGGSENIVGLPVCTLSAATAGSMYYLLTEMGTFIVMGKRWM